MLQTTRQAFNNYTNGLGQWLGYGGDIRNEMVTYPPERQQSAYSVAAEKADFLKKDQPYPSDCPSGATGRDWC